MDGAELGMGGAELGMGGAELDMGGAKLDSGKVWDVYEERRGGDAEDGGSEGGGRG